MPGSSGPVSCLRQKQEVSLEPLALAGTPHTFFWLGFLCHYRANCKKRSNYFCGISNSEQKLVHVVNQVNC